MSDPDPRVIAAIQERTMPFVNDPAYASSFYDATGRMILLWGSLEKALDDLLIASKIIAKSSGEKHDTYVSLSRKIKLLVSIFHSNPRLRGFHPRAVALANEIRKNADDRNLVIHAGFVGFEDGNPNKIKMQSLKPEDDRVIVTDFTVTVSNLSDMCSNFHLCSAKIIYLLIDIQEILKEAQAQDRARASRTPPT